MHAEIIAIGTEITSGAKLDTNSQWLSQKLGELGIAARYHTSVADDLAANVEVLRQAVSRADVVLITGGLGPTLDDLTRQALADLQSVELVEDPASFAAIEEMFASRGRPMPASNRIQAMFPQGSVPLPNSVGTAPGVWCEIPRDGRSPCQVAAMPGVPTEMKRMFKEYVEPRLAGDVCIRRAVINCFGLGESQTEEILGDLTRRGADPEVGITAHDATISLRIIAQGETPEDCQRKIDAVTAEIEARLGDYVFGRDQEEPEHVVVRLLHERRASVAVCEEATGGDLIRRIVEVPQSQSACAGGLVLVGPGDGAKLLNIDTQTHPTSAEAGHALACRLAESVRVRLDATYGLAVTPWGELPLENGRPPVPTAWVALASQEGTVSSEARQTGNPAIFAARTAKTALDLLRRRLLNLPERE